MGERIPGVGLPALLVAGSPGGELQSTIPRRAPPRARAPTKPSLDAIWFPVSRRSRSVAPITSFQSKISGNNHTLLQQAGARRRRPGRWSLLHGFRTGAGTDSLLLSRFGGCGWSVAGLRMERRFGGCGKFTQPFPQATGRLFSLRLSKFSFHTHIHRPLEMLLRGPFYTRASYLIMWQAVDSSECQWTTSSISVGCLNYAYHIPIDMLIGVSDICPTYF